MKQIHRLLAVSLALVVFGPTPTLAQRQANQTLERYGVEKYFERELEAGTQSRIRSGATDSIGAATALRVGEYLVTRIPTGAVLESDRGSEDLGIKLPDRAFLEVGGTGRFLVPVVLIEGGALRYNYEEKLFRGLIRVGVRDSLNPASVVNLPNPLTFLVTGAADTITPQEFAVDHTNLPFPQVEIAVAAPSDSLELDVRSTLHPDGVEISIPINRRELPFSVSPNRIQGLGLETSTLSIGPTDNAEGLVVGFSAAKGNLGQSEVTLSASGTAVNSIRSWGWGTDTVQVNSPVYRRAEAVVQYAFPTLFLIVALVGGAIGGLLKSFVHGRKSEGDEKKAGAFWKFVVSGALFGLVVSAAYAVGINLLNVEPTVTTGQVVVFVLAAFGGYIGGPALRSLVP